MPRARAPADPDAKLRAYNEFIESPEYKSVQFINKYKKDENHELGRMERGTEDIIDEWQDIIDAVFSLLTGLKVPGRKSKLYEQHIFRTMIFKKGAETGGQQLEIKIDGFPHPMNVSVDTDHYNCKGSFLELTQQLLNFDDVEVDSFASWKKDLIAKLKDFEKKYIKHAKAPHKELKEI